MTSLPWYLTWFTIMQRVKRKHTFYCFLKWLVRCFLHSKPEYLLWRASVCLSFRWSIHSFILCHSASALHQWMDIVKILVNN